MFLVGVRGERRGSGVGGYSLGRKNI